MDTLTTYPSEIDSIVEGEIEHVFKVDFTGDSTSDYIIHSHIKKQGQSLRLG